MAPCRLTLAAAALLLLAAGSAAVPHEGHRSPVPAAFANEGGPPFLDVGLVYLHNMTTGYGAADGAIGVLLNGTYTFTFVTDGGVRTERGRYLSWECAAGAPVNGTYRALVEVVTTEPDGAASPPRTLCQLGIVDHDVERGPWLDWAQSEDECPHYTSVSFDLLSHPRVEQLSNTCGDPTPETPPVPSELPQENEAALEGGEGAAEGTGGTEQEEGGAEDGSSSSDDGSGAQVVREAVPDPEPLEPQRRPFTPGREEEEA